MCKIRESSWSPHGAHSRKIQDETGDITDAPLFSNSPSVIKPKSIPKDKKLRQKQALDDFVIVERPSIAETSANGQRGDEISEGWEFGDLVDLSRLSGNDDYCRATGPTPNPSDGKREDNTMLNNETSLRRDAKMAVKLVGNIGDQARSWDGETARYAQH